jgi:hypothetical protein
MKIRVGPLSRTGGTNHGQSGSSESRAPESAGLTLLLQECSNKRIGGQLQLRISPHTALRPLFVLAGIFDGPKRAEVARYAHDGESTIMTPCQGLNPKESQVSILVWVVLSNREIGQERRYQRTGNQESFVPRI